MANYVDPPNGVRSGGKHYFSMWQTLFEIDTKYVPIKAFGRGAYGIVCSSINRETNETDTIKRINNVFDNRIDALRTLRELKLLRHLRHENVMALKDVMVPVQRRSFKDVYLAYELMDTDLHQIIKPSQALSNDLPVFSISGMGIEVFDMEKPVVFTYEEIIFSTDSFTDSNLLGHETYGSVYYALLRYQAIHPFRGLLGFKLHLTLHVVWNAFMSTPKFIMSIETSKQAIP